MKMQVCNRRLLFDGILIMRCILGIVTVSMCNQRRQSEMLDAMWPHIRHSLPDKWVSDPGVFSYKLCEKFKGDRPTLEVTFHHNTTVPARGNQKFKLLNVKVCQVSSANGKQG